jgi:lipopolysaccharide transport system permease protein
MQHFSIYPQEMIASVWRNRCLIKALVKREVIGRYRGSMMGILWSFFNPLFMLLIYTFVFSEVFKARWTGGSDSKTEFALILFAGLLVFNLFSECISRAPGVILANVNYVKKVVFPLEILLWVNLGSALFHACISLLVWLIFYAFLYGVPRMEILLMPIILLPFLLFIMGLSWLLASLGVFIRDISQFIGPIITALMFLSPIFYPASTLPEKYQALLLWNPLTSVIEQSRAIMVWGVFPDWHMYTIYLTASLLVAWLGFAWFQKTRKGFADVL